MNRRSLSRLALAAFVAALGLLLLTSLASASELKLKCGGKGPRNKDSAGTVLCAAAPGKARVLTGTVRNDAGKPVAAKILVTFIAWTPVNGYFTLSPVDTKTIVANANGAFSLPVKTSTRLNVKFETVADEKLGVSGTFAEAQVSRQLAVKLKKLGGGKIKISVKGAGKIKIRIYVLDSYGYELSGVKPKKPNKAGVATFNLGNLRGEFSYFVDAGVYGDLYWEGARPTFKL